MADVPVLRVIDLGVCVASRVDDIEYAVLAEQLGFSHLWFADSQMLWSDCYATMALAAARTERIRIGTGVAVAGTRTERGDRGRPRHDQPPGARAACSAPSGPATRRTA